jgi:SAM-dependent methyltransferase
VTFSNPIRRTSSYNNDADYCTPYHWYLKKEDLSRGGAEYWQYINIVKDLVKPLKKEKILEVGCGDGRTADYLGEVFPESQVLGIDISEKAIGFARLLARHSQFRHADVYRVDEKFDCLLLIEVLEHIPRAEVNPFLKKVASLLLPQGHLILSVPSTNLPMLHPGHVQHFTTEKLQAELENAGLKMDEVVYHLDIRFSRWSRLGRLAIGLCDNRFWVLHPGMRFLLWLQNTIAGKPEARYAARIVARAVPFSWAVP